MRTPPAYCACGPPSSLLRMRTKPAFCTCGPEQCSAHAEDIVALRMLTKTGLCACPAPCRSAHADSSSVLTEQLRPFRRTTGPADPMAVPPSYSDLGKSARDVFNKGYGFGMVKLELKTKSSSGVEFTATGSSNTDTGKALGNLETKYKIKDYGLTFIQKWNTDNTLGTEVSMEDQLAEGLKVALDTIFVPNTGKKSGKLKTSYRREYVNLGCNIDIDLSGPTIYGWAVLGYEGWLAGYQMAFDTAKSKLSQNNFALGYKAGDFQLHTNVNDGTEFGGSIYQKVNNKVETSVNLAWTAGSNNTRFGIAAKYQLDEKTSIVAKVNNASLIGIGYTLALRPGVKLTLSGLIDGKNFSAGGHKVGLGFELEA